MNRFAIVLGVVLAVSAAGGARTVDGAGGADAIGRFNVRDFGAVGDGKAMDTTAINAAIEAAAKAGGGTVYFPAGTYASYAVHLKSNLTLYLEHGAVLRAAGGISGTREAQGGSSKEESRRDEGPAGNQTAPSSGPAVESAFLPTTTAPTVSAAAPVAGGKWDEAEPNEWDAYQDYGHSHFHNSFIWGEDLHDISIEGPGMIDGAGLLTNAGPQSTIANKALALKKCHNVTLRDVTFFRGGHLCIEDVRISNLRIVYPGGGTGAQAKNVPPEREASNYPEPIRFGVLPSSAFFIRHVKGLEMHHVTVTYERADARPALALVDVSGADFQHLNIQRFEDVPYFSLHQVRDFSTQYVRSLADMKRDLVDTELLSK